MAGSDHVQFENAAIVVYANFGELLGKTEPL